MCKKNVCLLDERPNSNYSWLMMKETMLLIALPFIVSCVFSRTAPPKKLQVGSNDTIAITTLGQVIDEYVMIEHDVDLGGAVCTIPHGKILVFKGGIVRNGILNGNETRIAAQGKVFDRVSIQGTWNIPEISTGLFIDLKYENSLRDVIALSSPSVKNTIIIEEGDYTVKVGSESETCIFLGSNTHLILNGNVRLKPNNFKSYNIFQATGENIRIEGHGCVIGDKEMHTGTEGEWGMGINLSGAVNTLVKGITVKDCWGDCVYVGGRSRNVQMENCKLDNGRRQGISVTKADSVTIRNCLIMNVCGTNPQYAIDIEPNIRDTVDHVIIKNVEVENCVGGIVISNIPRKKKAGATIGSVTIKNCILTARKKYPLCVRGCDFLKIDSSTFYVTNQRAAMYFNKVKDMSAYNNDIFVKRSILTRIKKSINSVINDINDSLIVTKDVLRKDITNLSVLEK